MGSHVLLLWVTGRRRGAYSTARTR